MQLYKRVGFVYKRVDFMYKNILINIPYMGFPLVLWSFPLAEGCASEDACTPAWDCARGSCACNQRQVWHKKAGQWLCFILAP